ncbi:MAG: FAD-dependent thymidylate synthase [Candidatus Izemoplasma sp.]
MTQINYVGKGGISAKIIADSIYGEVRLPTLQLRFHRFILPEFNTHRVFSRNASSSRAIPVKKLLEQVSNDPAIPVEFGKNQAGMQSAGPHNASIYHENEEGRGFHFKGGDNNALSYWKSLAANMHYAVEPLIEAGYHKQVANRLSEPFQFINIIVSSTEWENFFKLRLHPAAQPEIQELARVMKKALDASTPKKMTPTEWHLPYVSKEDEILIWEYVDKNMLKSPILFEDAILLVSAARCARVSYLNHDKSDPDIGADIKLAKMLHQMEHLSPFEHQAKPMNDPIFFDTDNDAIKFLETKGVTHLDADCNFWSGNFKSWIQYRQIM